METISCFQLVCRVYGREFTCYSLITVELLLFIMSINDDSDNVHEAKRANQTRPRRFEEEKRNRSTTSEKVESSKEVSTVKRTF